MRSVAMACAVASPMAIAAPLDDSNYLAVDLFAVQHEERIPDRDLGFGGRLGAGYPISRGGFGQIALELGIFHNPIELKEGRAGRQTGAMLDLVQSYAIGGMTPYLFAGLGFVDEKAGAADDIFFAIEAGGGLMFNAFGSTRARVGLSAMSVQNDVSDPGQDALVDLRFNIGLVFPEAGAAPVASAPRAVDSDGDGLPDDKDACPTTPASTADGCPPPAPVVQTDSDGDGVVDARDNCPGTLAGLKVDASGCAIETGAQSIVLKGVTFLPGSATLTADAKAVLDGAASALAGQKNLKIELGGYTDSQGRDAANLALSQRRANSVRQYLIDKGIEADRLTAKGYGEASPIADNDTVDGRAENRRVELKIVQ